MVPLPRDRQHATDLVRTHLRTPRFWFQPLIGQQRRIGTREKATIRREALAPVGHRAYTRRYRTRSDTPKMGISEIRPPLTSTAGRHPHSGTAITSLHKRLIAITPVAVAMADTATAAELLPTALTGRGRTSALSITETGESRMTCIRFRIEIVRTKRSHRQAGVGSRGTKGATERTLAVTTTPSTELHPRNRPHLRMTTA